MEGYSLKFEIDASQAEQGAKQFTSALNTAARSAVSFDQKVAEAFKKINSLSSGAFGKLARDISKLNSVRISSSLGTSVSKLNSAMASFKAPSSSSIAGLRSFFSIMNNARVNTTSINSIGRLSAALNGFRGPSQASVRNTTAFVNAMASIRVPRGFSQIAQGIAVMAAAASRASGSFSRLGATVNSINFGRFSSGLNQSIGRMKALSSSASAGTGLLSAFGSAISLAGIVGATRSLMETGAQLNSFRIAITAVTGSSEEAGRALAFVKQNADNLAAPLSQSIQEYGKFAAATRTAGLSADSTEGVFTALSTAGRALGLDAEQMGRNFNTATQIFSKGKLSAEELRQQFGDSLPGAFQLMEKGLKKIGAIKPGETLDELLKQGKIGSAAMKVLAKELLATYGSKIPEALQTSTAQFQLLANQFTLLKNSIATSGFDKALADQFGQIRRLISTPEVQAAVNRIGQSLASVATKVGETIQFLIRNFDTVLPVLKAFAVALTFSATGGVLSSITGGFRSMFAVLSLTPGATTAVNLLSKSFIAMRAAAVTSFATILAPLAPIAAVVGGIGLAIGGVMAYLFDWSSLWATISSDQYSTMNKFLGLWDILAGYASAAGSAIAGVMRSVYESIATAFSGGYEYVLSFFGSVGQFLGRIRDRFADAFQTAAGWVGWFGDRAIAVFMAFGTTVLEIAMSIKDSYTAVFSGLADSMSKLLQGDFSGAKESFSGIGQGLEDAMNRAKNSFSEGAQAYKDYGSVFTDTVKSAASTASGALNSVYGNISAGMTSLGVSTQESINKFNQAYAAAVEARQKAETARTAADKAAADAEVKRAQEDLKKAQENIGAVSAGDVRISADDSEKSIKKLTKSFNDLRGELDPSFEAAHKFEEKLKTLDNAVKNSLISPEIYAKLVGKITTEYNDAIKAGGAWGDKLRGLVGELSPVSNKTYEYEDKLKTLDRALKEGNISAEAHAKLLKELKFQYSEVSGGAGMFKDGVQSYADSLGTFEQNFSKFGEDVSSGFIDNMTEMLATGKNNFASFVEDIKKMAIKMALQSIFKNIFGGADKKVDLKFGGEPKLFDSSAVQAHGQQLLANQMALEANTAALQAINATDAFGNKTFQGPGVSGVNAPNTSYNNPDISNVYKRFQPGFRGPFVDGLSNKPVSYTGSVGGAINQASMKSGISSDYYSRLAQIESGGNPFAQAKTSSAGGLFQFTDGTARRYGLTNKYDPYQGASAVASLTTDNANYLQGRLGRAPTAGELYLAHQQGAGGAAALLSNPNANAASVIGQKQVLNNGGTMDMSSAQFANMWTKKFDGVSTNVSQKFQTSMNKSVGMVSQKTSQSMGKAADSAGRKLNSSLSGANGGLNRTAQTAREAGMASNQASQQIKTYSSTVQQSGSAASAAATQVQSAGGSGGAGLGGLFSSLGSGMSSIFSNIMPLFQNLLGGSGGGMGGILSLIPNLLGFAEGGSMTVGGHGGQDTKLAAFRVSPGEHITIKTPAQLRAEERSMRRAESQGHGNSLTSGGNGVNIVNVVDPTMAIAAMRSGNGRAEIYNAIKKNPNEIRQLMRQ